MVGLVDGSTWQSLSDKLVDLVLTTKNDEKMPSALARGMLHFWQQDSLTSKLGLAVLLEAAVKLEPERTLSILSELQLGDLESKVRERLPL